MKKYFFFLGILLSFYATSQTLPPKADYPLTIRQLHCGHSLTDPLFNPWPGQYRYLVSDILGGTFDNIGKSTIPGSPMRYRWENLPGYGQPSAREDIDDWELLCITESVPLNYVGGGTDQWYLDRITEQREYLSLFVNNAWDNGNNGNGAPTLLWTTWTNIDNSDGPWRAMLDTYELEWEAMQDYANANRPAGAPPVYLIPGHRMMARLYDDIQLGNVPGITNISQFFSDNIHMNELGSYAVAMIHYACIYNESPVGLTNDLLTDATPIPSPALAAYLQNMIWEVVTSYPRTGIYVALKINDKLKKNTVGPVVKNRIELYPNPATNMVMVDYKGEDQEKLNQPIKIYDMQGTILIENLGNKIDISQLKSGIYYVNLYGSIKKLIKE